MKKFLLICFIFALSSPCLACKKKDNLTTISKNLTNYEINLELDCDQKSVTATQKVNYTNNTNAILKNIKFHLYPQYFEKGGTEKIIASTKMNSTYPNGLNFAEFNINRLTVENTEKPIKHENELDSILNVELNSSLLPNNSVEIYMEYSFKLPNCLHRFGYGNNTINLGNFYPIACVYENGEFVTDGYNANGDPFYSDMSNYCVNINLNQQYIVASTGEKLNETIENGKKKVCFNAKVVRDFAIIVSDKFEVINEKIKNTNIEYYYFSDTNPSKSLQAGADAIKTFSNLFGNYPYSTFSIVECDFVHGGMEYPNLVMINTLIENQDDYINVIIHETAHQWWYGMVGNNSYSHPWLDEALTEFSTLLFYDNCEGYNLTHQKMIEYSHENYSLFISVYEDVLGHIDTSLRPIDQYATEPEYTYCVYVKGVLMFESLYQLVGEKNFIESLKSYFEDNKYTNVAPQHLINAFNNSCKQDLTNFFSSWIDGKVVIK